MMLTFSQKKNKNSKTHILNFLLRRKKKMDEVQGPLSIAQEFVDQAAESRNDFFLKRVPHAVRTRPRAILLIGAPGSGKTTQGKLLASRRSNTIHLSTGDYFREQVKGQTKLGIEIAKYLDADCFVPDNIVVDVLSRTIEQNPGKVLVLDGVPRNVAQSLLLKDMFHIIRVLYLDLSPEACTHRVLLRLEEDNERKDTPESTQKRLQYFFSSLALVLEPFLGKIAVVDASWELDDVSCNVDIAMQQTVLNNVAFCNCKLRLANQLIVPCGHCSQCFECCKEEKLCVICKAPKEHCIALGPKEQKDPLNGIQLTSAFVNPLQTNRAKVCFSVHVPHSNERVGQHIVAIVDISTSMHSTKAQQENEHGELVDLPYSLLDAVKFSLKTLVKCMIDKDHFTLVTFARHSNTLMENEPMNEANVERALQLIDAMQANGSTNLWDGLLRGLNIVQRSSDHMPATIALLTDGRPDQGCDGIADFAKWLQQSRRLPFELVTFGYGSNLMVNVLFELAQLGNGNYIWIPSSSETGSIFVKFMANACCVVAQDATLEIQTRNSSNIVADPPGIATKAILQRNINSCIVKLGSLRAGQTQEVVLDMRIPGGTNSYATLTLRFHESQPICTEANNLQCDITAMEAYARLNMCQELSKALMDSLDAEYHVQEVIQHLETIAATHPVAAFYLKDLKGELQDDGRLEGGKILKGAQTARFARWGCHLLPSYLTTHQRKLCSNMYEVGCMPYITIWNAAFTEMGKQFYEQFAPTVAAEAPKPLVTYHYAAQASNAGPISSFSSSASGFSGGGCGSCIAGNCTVVTRLSNGTLQQRTVAEIRVGDWVQGTQHDFHKIKFVLQKTAPTPLFDFPCGLRLSERHPFREPGSHTWRRAELEFDQTTSIESVVYNFVLDKGISMLVNGIECLCLGHDLEDHKVYHPLYASSKRMHEACSNLIQQANQTIVFQTVLRDCNNRVCGFVQTS